MGNGILENFQPMMQKLWMIFYFCKPIFWKRVKNDIETSWSISNQGLENREHYVSRRKFLFLTNFYKKKWKFEKLLTKSSWYFRAIFRRFKQNEAKYFFKNFDYRAEIIILNRKSQFSNYETWLNFYTISKKLGLENFRKIFIFLWFKSELNHCLNCAFLVLRQIMQFYALLIFVPKIRD